MLSGVVFNLLHTSNMYYNKNLFFWNVHKYLLLILCVLKQFTLFTVWFEVLISIDTWYVLRIFMKWLLILLNVQDSRNWKWFDISIFFDWSQFGLFFRIPMCSNFMTKFKNEWKGILHSIEVKKQTLLPFTTHMQFNLKK